MFEAQQLPSAVDDYADGVETDLFRPWTGDLGVGQPCASQTAQTGALLRSQPLQRVGERGARPPWMCGRGEHPARLDLHEHEGLAVEADQVDLAKAGAHVSVDHLEAETLEVASCVILATAARSPAVIPV